tara:strand:- start:5 stop:247 length:243 start_codon:yes stop_codon:yes gene_type:complete
METPNLDREINDLEYYESKDELTDQGTRTLKELRELKQLALCSVSNNEVALKAFVEEYVEAFEDGQGSDTALYRQAKSLL